jgi:tetratricopeptide (TPR) repeat protein
MAREGLFAETVGELEKVLDIDFNHPGIASALKAAGFWRERQEAEKRLADAYEKGEYLLAQWRAFKDFTDGLADVPEAFVYACGQYAFQAALRHYLRLRDEGPFEEPDVMSRMGRCYKGIGDYENAIACLENANRIRPEDADLLSELADCYALVNETRAAKIFFREAFFLDPQAVDLEALESPMILRLAQSVRALGYGDPEVNEWIPVYGTVYGVFNVKREMKPLELGKLKQSIFLLHKEIETEPKARGLAPRLINRYFWLIDHYRTVGESRRKIDEVLEKIREIDPGVHRQYAT